FGLRSASGDSGAEGGDERIANRRRSATPRTEPQTEVAARAATRTDVARDERGGLWSGTGLVERETGPTESPWNGAIRALVTAIEWFGLALPVSFFGSWVEASGDFRHEIALCWKRSEQSLNSRRSRNSSAQNRIARLHGCCGNHTSC